MFRFFLARPSLKLSLLPFLLVAHQHYSNPFSCFFFESGPKKNRMENRITVVQYQANSPIEDAYACDQVQSVEGYFISVFDGHGGWQLSKYASQALGALFKEAIQKNNTNTSLPPQEIVQAAIKDAYKSLETSYYNMVLQAYRLGFHQTSRVGSCALSVFVSGEKVYVANLGDCKATLISRKGKEFVAQKLTHKLNANSKKEQARLRSQFPDDKEIFVCRKGNASACYVKNSLQPTRSFGDLRLKHPEFNNPESKGLEYGYPRRIVDFKGPYIIAEPEISVFDISSEDRFLVMGSDGLWDELNQRDIARIIGANSGETKEKLAEKIFTAAFENAAKSHRMSVEELRKTPTGAIRRKLHDDITLILIDLKNQGKS